MILVFSRWNSMSVITPSFRKASNLAISSAAESGWMTGLEAAACRGNAEPIAHPVIPINQPTQPQPVEMIPPQEPKTIKDPTM